MIGRALPHDSGFNGFWVSGPHAKTFDEQPFRDYRSIGAMTPSLIASFADGVEILAKSGDVW